MGYTIYPYGKALFVFWQAILGRCAIRAKRAPFARSWKRWAFTTSWTIQRGHGCQRRFRGYSHMAHGLLVVYIYIHWTRTQRVSTFHPQTKTNSQNKFREDEYITSYQHPPTGLLQRVLGPQQVSIGDLLEAAGICISLIAVFYGCRRNQFTQPTWSTY